MTLLSVRCFPDKSDGVVCVRNSSSFEGSPTSPIKKPNMAEPPACSQMAADSDCWPPPDRGSISPSDRFLWSSVQFHTSPFVKHGFLTAVLHWDHFCWDSREQQTISRRSRSSLCSRLSSLLDCFPVSFRRCSFVADSFLDVTLLLPSFLRISNSSFVCAEIFFHAVKLFSLRFFIDSTKEIVQKCVVWQAAGNKVSKDTF